MTLQQFLSEWNSPSATVTVHTSGSTGTPKPMEVEKRRMLASARITCDFLGLRPGDTALLCMPLDYIAGKMVVVRSLERRLQLVSVQPDGHPLSDASLGQYARQLYASPDGGLTFAAMVPLQVYNSLRVPEEARRLKAVRQLIIGGGAIDEELACQLKTFPHAVWSTYGMTETLSHIALRRLSGPDASEWYTPFDTVAVSLNADGCLVIDAPLVHEGTLVTHDRAVINAQGQFRILGRLDNVIDTGGIKVQAEEVEAALKPVLRAPFMITRAKDPKFGEAIVLLTEHPDPDSLKDACRQVLPHYWLPRHYLHIDHLPLTGTGKPARAQAEQWVARHQASDTTEM